MGDAFTTLWNRERYDAARRHAPPDFRLDLLFGGPHTSMPQFRRAGARAGDWIYPITLRGGVLHLLGRMRVERVLDLAEFEEQSPERAAAYEPFDLAIRPFDPHVRRPETLFLAPTCTDEVVIGEAGTPLLFDLMVPPDEVARLRYVSRRGERPIKHVNPDGRVTSVVSLQGIYRLAPASAAVLASLVESRVNVPAR